MSDGLTIAEISMLNDMKQLQSISHNLANVNTAGYKGQLIMTSGFQELLSMTQGDGQAGSGSSDVVVNLPQVKTTVDTRSGALKFTGKPLDVAMAENVFLAIQSTAGEVYTRQGDLHLDARGRLVTSSGLEVQGVSGEIRLSSDKPLINKQGEIYIDEQLVAQLKLVKFADRENIKSLGGALYTASGQAELVDSDELVFQGYTEASNVNMTDQMVKMIELNRHFESTQKLVRGYDMMLESAINDVANFEGY